MYLNSDGDMNTFTLLLRKVVYAYEYMGSWKRFDKTSLPGKKDFYGSLNVDVEGITDVDHRHAKIV